VDGRTCKGCRRVREKDMADDNALELVSQITELNDLHDFMEDDDVDRALHLVVKLLMNKGATPANAPKLIVELQALATLFAIKATFYQSIGKAGSKEAHMKNVYFTLKDSISKLVDALKYSAKEAH
jgi:hypothetical protein